MLAAQAGDEDITRLLLDVGADPNYVQSVSYCPTQKPPVFVKMAPEFTQKVGRETNGNVCNVHRRGGQRL
jgi:dihydroorotate dehydrogenase